MKSLFIVLFSLVSISLTAHATVAKPVLSCKAVLTYAYKNVPVSGMTKHIYLPEIIVEKDGSDVETLLKDDEGQPLLKVRARATMLNKKLAYISSFIQTAEKGYTRASASGTTLLGATNTLTVFDGLQDGDIEAEIAPGHGIGADVPTPVLIQSVSFLCNVK